MLEEFFECLFNFFSSIISSSFSYCSSISSLAIMEYIFTNASLLNG
jgi:hypothetical protein